MVKETHVLTLSCPDRMGIAAKVFTKISAEGGFIKEAAQFGDDLSKRFFMRIVFTTENSESMRSVLKESLKPLAAEFKMDWKIHNADRPARLLLLVSKESHCLNDILQRYRTGLLNIEIAGVISNHEDMRDFVEWHKIPYFYFPLPKGSSFEEKRIQENKIIKLYKDLHVDLVVLARYMQILSDEMCSELAGHCINIHHSFLPSFKGAKPYHQAYERGVKLIGATAHYVTANLDEGPIIEQAVERVDHTNTPEQLVAMGKDLENIVLSRALRYHIERRILLNGVRTVIFK
ncbi:MAG: formyltetrahydrofolate deformylase [Alphaproteobacteria bacterium]|nr:formyltetrahydrofolate deformylase [Alphaproteobacteria bacterium]